MNLDQQTRALLDLVEADRAKQCAQILGDQRARSAASSAQAQAEAREHLRQAFTEQRTSQREQIAAAQARLATQRRLHAQQRSAALLRLAWQQLPGEMLALWQEPGSRARWVAQVIAWAQARLPAGPWRLRHPPDWPLAERQTIAIDGHDAPVFEADPAIAAGLKVLAHGNVIDGTLAGLLDDRLAIEAQLLRRLEQPA